MNRNARFIASILSVTLLTSGITYIVLEPRGQKEVVIAQPNRVLVFSNDLPAGHTLTARDFRWVKASTPSGPAGDVLQKEEEKLAAIGGRLSQSVVAGELVLKSSYSPKPAKGVLAERLNPGFRALTIASDPTQLAAGRLLPGDHVDVVLAPPGSQQNVGLPLPNFSSPSAVGTDVTRLYENVRVLAISGATEPADSSDGKMDSSLLKDATITLELRPDQADRLLAASALGRIVLLLRRPFDAVGEGRTAPGMVRARPLTTTRPALPAAATDSTLSATPSAPQGVIIVRGTN